MGGGAMHTDIIPASLVPSWVIKGKYSIEADAYYTDVRIAKMCYDYLIDTLGTVGIDINDYTFIEPSAGEGVFYDLLPSNRIGMDISTTHPDIKILNFFDYEPNRKLKYIAIGNPPFGVRSWLALSFINRCAEFCSAVGFVLPMYFASNGKGSAKSRVKNMDLIVSKELPADIFTRPDGNMVSINTVFQIWIKKGIATPISDIVPVNKIKEYVDIYTVCTAPARRCGLDKLHLYDCFLQSTYYRSPTIVNTFEQVQYGSGYGIIIKREKPRIKQMLKRVDWDKHALRATNHCKHLGMYSIYSGLYSEGLLSC